MPDNQKFLSVVVPIYSEEEVLPKFYARVTAVLQSLNRDYELVFVNDGSTDRSLSLLLELQRKDPAVRVIDLSRNFGHQVAITAGIDVARGDAVVLIDGDLQDPPEVIPAMVEKWQEGFDVVYGKRRRRAGERPLKRWLAFTYYRILASLSDVALPPDVGDFRLLDRAVADVIRSMREENRYLRGMVCWAGFHQCGIEYDRDIRYAGEPKYTFFRSLRLGFDGIASFSEKPLTLVSYFGMLTTFASVLLIVWLLVGRLFWPETVVTGWTSLAAAIVFFGGVQLLALGVVGQYLGRVYREVKERPLYVIRRHYGSATMNGNEMARENRVIAAQPVPVPRALETLASRGDIHE
jgi:dolichol-phosphate mannosyltransferase